MLGGLLLDAVKFFRDSVLCFSHFEDLVGNGSNNFLELIVLDSNLLSQFPGFAFDCSIRYEDMVSC